MVERQFTKKLKNVQTDWGGKFRNLASLFSSLGNIHWRSCPHTSEQNGLVEHRNRHVVETAPPIMDIVVLISLPSIFILLDMFVLMKHNFPLISLKTTSPPPSKTSPYYSSESPYVIPTTDHPSPSSPRSSISSPSLVSHLSPTSQTSHVSSNGQPSPVSITSIPTPPPPIPPPPPPPPITR
ncbi:retrovirus-related pol polyprotein from transposon TNT 1-94 [Tanacetum coccineum]